MKLQKLFTMLDKRDWFVIVDTQLDAGSEAALRFVLSHWGFVLFSVKGLGRRGGVSLCMSAKFVQQFSGWEVEACPEGRMAAWTFWGEDAGKLQIIGAYLDPHNVKVRMAQIKSLGGMVDSSCFTAVVGDWNFVEDPGDRFSVSGGDFPGWDKGETKAWSDCVSKRGMVEIEQGEMSLTRTSGSSRIDRVFLSVHLVDPLIWGLYAKVGPWPGRASDHRPLFVEKLKRRIRKGFLLKSGFFVLRNFGSWWWHCGRIKNYILYLRLVF